jgi:MoaA/NifB/PqqE/SkfB family radical SAM enzyme
VEAWERGERVAPITVDCSLTRKCNYDCVYCYGKLQVNDEKKMTWKVIKNFLDDAKEIGVKAVSFVSDGESTCSPHWRKAILHGHSIGLDMALGTNGLLFKPHVDILRALTYLRFNISAGESSRYAEIHGVPEKHYKKVVGHIRRCVRIKQANNLDVTIGIQMVLMPEFADQIIPFALLGKELGVDYAIIKHCSDDELGTLGIDYGKYEELVPLLHEAEALSDGDYLVKAKWSKILHPERKYSRCYGPSFIMQFSGSGLVAPCGMLFNDRYKKKYHIGNIAEKRFKDIWNSQRYQDVLNRIASDEFDARKMCGSLCLQHKCVGHCVYNINVMNFYGIGNRGNQDSRLRRQDRNI